MTRPELITQRLKLRIYSAQDAEEMYSHITPTLTRFMAWEPPATYEEFMENKVLWEERFLQGTDYHFVARDLQTGRYIGVVGVHRASTATPEFGVWMSEDVHGQALVKKLSLRFSNGQRKPCKWIISSIRQLMKTGRAVRSLNLWADSLSHLSKSRNICR